MRAESKSGRSAHLVGRPRASSSLLVLLVWLLKIITRCVEHDSTHRPTHPHGMPPTINLASMTIHDRYIRTYVEAQSAIIQSHVNGIMTPIGKLSHLIAN